MKWLPFHTLCIKKDPVIVAISQVWFSIRCEVNLPQPLIPHLIGKYSQAQVRIGGAEEE